MYENWLNNQSIFFRRQTLWLLVLFFVLRLLSFVLNEHLIIQGILVFALLMILGTLYFKKPDWAWCLVLAEIFLGGSGHYFELLGLSIRTLFIIFFMFLWLADLLGKQKLKISLDIGKQPLLMVAVFFAFLAFSFFNGLNNGHDIRLIIQDTIPFTFLLLLFPSFHFFKDESTQDFLVRLIIVFIIGQALFSLFTFLGFSTGFFHLQDGFYHWFRDINVGKITDMGNSFFRIVESSHILVVPIILLITSLRMRAEKHHKMWRLLQFFAIIILTINFSRSYFLAIAIGLLILKYKHSWKKWLWECATMAIMAAIIFTGVHYLSSGGKTFGWELFGLRIKSFVQPEIEVSANTRLMILQPALDLIKTNPLAGTGLGASISFLNTDTFEYITTNSFDWGYLEMWAELGILGSLMLIVLYLYTAYKILVKIKNIPDWHDFDVGIMASIIAFLVMNVTTPALFHVFGILFLTFAMAVGLKHTDAFERITTVLYRIFNRLK